MGHRIIKQPDGRWAIFSTVCDGWIFFDATKEEIIEHEVAQAAEREREAMNRLFADLAVSPEYKYRQFAMTFEEADATSYEHVGRTMAMMREEMESAEGDDGTSSA